MHVKFTPNWPNDIGADLKKNSIFSCGGHFVHLYGTILTFLVESHLGNIHVKFD